MRPHEGIVWRYRPGPDDIGRCARCGQTCMPFPVRESWTGSTALGQDRAP